MAKWVPGGTRRLVTCPTISSGKTRSKVTTFSEWELIQMSYEKKKNFHGSLTPNLNCKSIENLNLEALIDLSDWKLHFRKKISSIFHILSVFYSFDVTSINWI